MKMTKSTYLTALLFGILLLLPPQGWTQPNPEKRGASIIHAFAVDQGHYGYIWKIYLEAEDPNGQMFKIACSVDQPGFGRYPTDWIYLKPEFQKHFKGYIQWNTFTSKISPLLDGTYITLKVSVVDKAGNESNSVFFPFTFRSGVTSQPTLPPPFDQGYIQRLGHIDIDLYEPVLIPQG